MDTKLLILKRTLTWLAVASLPVLVAMATAAPQCPSCSI